MTMHTRRQMIGFAAGAGVAAAIGTGMPGTLAQSPEIEPTGSGWLGLTRDEWEAIAGAGVELDELVEYPHPSVDGSTILVRYDADRVSHMEIGFEGSERGGLPPEDASAVVTQALPSGWVVLDRFIVPALNREQTLYRAVSHMTDTPETDGFLALFQERDVGFGSGGELATVVVRVTLTLPGVHTLIAEETGDPGGIGLPREDWEDIHGPSEPAQTGDWYDSVIVPGYRLLVRFAPEEGWVSLIDARADEDAAQWGEVRPLALASLPADAVLEHTYDLPATPEGPIALAAELWRSESLAGMSGGSGAVFVLYQLEGGSPVVPRLSITVPVMS